MVHMNTLSLALFAAILLLGQMVNMAMASVTVTQDANAGKLSSTLLNPAAAGNEVMTITGATITGDNRQFGTFSQTIGDLPGLGSTGVVLSTGIAKDIITGVQVSSQMGGNGDQALEISGGSTGHDA
jgi:hypothetical protein